MPAGKTYEGYPGHYFHYSVCLALDFPAPVGPASCGSVQLHKVGVKKLKPDLQILLSSTFLKHNDFLLLFGQCAEGSGIAGTWIWSSWGMRLRSEWNTDGPFADSGWVLCDTRVQFPNKRIPELAPPQPIIQLLPILCFVEFF